MTEKRFQVYIDSNNLKSLWDDNGDGEPLLFLDREDTIQGVDEVCDLLNEQHEQIERLKRNFKALDEVKCELAEENEQLKQFPVKLDNRIQKLEESLKALKEMETDDLNTQAVEDVATIIGMSLNALMEFRKELKGDVE